MKTQPGLVAQPLLLHRPDRDAVVAEDRGHRGEHARTVERRRGSGSTRSCRSSIGPDASGLPVAAPARWPPASRFRAASIRSPTHRARRRQPAGTLAVEHELAGGLALDEHGVEGPPHRRPAGATAGTIAGWTRTESVRSAVDALDDRQQLDHVAEAVGEGDVDRAGRR